MSKEYSCRPESPGNNTPTGLARVESRDALQDKGLKGYRALVRRAALRNFANVADIAAKEEEEGGGGL